MGNYTKPQKGAIAVGALIAVGAAVVLLEDIRHTHTVTIDHILSVIVLIGTIVAGVYAVEAWGSWRTWPRALALSVLFAIGTFYCVTSTAGRTADGQASKQLEAEANNQKRADVLADRKKAQDMLDEQMHKHAAECSSGPGKRCNGIKESIAVYQAAVKGHDADLAKLGPEIPVNSKVKNVSALIAIVRGLDDAGRKRLEATLTLLDPNIPALFLELGSITFFHIGFAGSRRRRAEPEIDLFARMRAFEASDGPPPAPLDPKPRKRAKPEERRKEVADFRDAFVKKHGREPMPADVRAALGYPRRASHAFLREIVAA